MQPWGCLPLGDGGALPKAGLAVVQRRVHAMKREGMCQ